MFWAVSRCGSEFVETLCQLSSRLCASIRTSFSVNSYEVPETQVVIEGIQCNIAWPRAACARLRNQPGNGPVPNNGCLSSTALTSKVGNLTNTHLVLGRKMFSRFSWAFSCSFKHFPTSAKVFIHANLFFMCKTQFAARLRCPEEWLQRDT